MIKDHNFFSYSFLVDLIDVIAISHSWAIDYVVIPMSLNITQHEVIMKIKVIALAEKSTLLLLSN